MSDLISRQETIKAVLEYQVEYCGAAFDIRMQEGMIKKLKDIPSAEPKKGKWLYFSNEGYVECPFCHAATNCDDNKDELHFCFSCGADMRKEE